MSLIKNAKDAVSPGGKHGVSSKESRDPIGFAVAALNTLAQSDLLAAGVIRAAEEAGLRVPEDVSVTGFDGIVVDGLAPYELTTLVQPASEKGRAAGEAVAAMLEGEPAASIRFTCVFREGSTTGPAPTGGLSAASS